MTITSETLELINEIIQSHKNPQIKKIDGNFDSESLKLINLIGFERPNPLKDHLIGFFTWKDERLFKFMYNLKTDSVSIDELAVEHKYNMAFLKTMESQEQFTTSDALDINTTSEWIQKHGTPEDKAVRFLFDQIKANKNTIL